MGCVTIWQLVGRVFAAAALRFFVAVAYPLSLGASQSRTTTTDYQNWNDANIGNASGIDTSGLEGDFHTSSSYGGFGADLTTYSQSVNDVNGITGLNRQAWIASSSGSGNSGSVPAGSVMSAGFFSINVPVPSTLTPSPGVSGTLARYMQSLLPNYFGGSAVSSNSNFVKADAYVDVLGQWQFAYDPNSTGAKHAFADDAGRLRLARANPDLTDTTSQGFHYFKRDAWGRVIEIGVLVGVSNTSLDSYADWGRQADFDEQLTSANSCALKTVVYDVDPQSGALEAYSNRRGAASKEVYYTTSIEDLPTSCPGREATSPSNQTWYAYDDIGRETANTEYRTGDAQTYRTTGYSWPNGLIAQWVYPDTDQSQAFTTTGQSSITLWPDMFGRTMRVCDGSDCSGTVYLGQTAFDWMGGALASTLGNGLSQSVTYDFAGDELSRSLKQGGTEVFGETVLRMQQPSGGAPPCGGSADQPNYAGGFVFAHGLSGSGLPSQDQNTWSCYSYDGAGRLVESDVYTADGDDWNGTISYSYGYDPNGNLTGIETGVPSAKAQGARLEPKLGTHFAGAAFPLQAVQAAAAEGTSTSFSRSGADQLTSAKLASGSDVALSYDTSNLYGDVGAISSGSQGYGLTLTRDAHTRQVTAQTISNNANGETVLTASIGYDPMGRRTSRSVTAVDEGSGSSTTSYWYGKALVPLVVVRDGVTYRMIGGLVIEERVNGEAATQYYPHRDYTSSVRVVTDGTGAIAASLGYDGDWGAARIAGQEYVSSDAGMAAFYRFQSQEAEIFPLAMLNITDTGLETWLDELQLHHFPYREYSAGLAVFMSQDPAKQSISPYAAMGANPANVGDPTGAVGGWFSKPAFRDFLFTATWGATSVALYAWLYPQYHGTDLEGFYTVLIMGFGRWVGNTAANVAYHHYVEVSERRILVRGLVPLDKVQPDSATEVALVSALKLEIAEAVAAFLSGLIPGAWPDGSWHWKALAFSGIALADAVYGTIRDRNTKWAYYMVDDRGGETAKAWAIFRRGSSDAAFYTLVAMGWQYASPTDTITTQYVQKFTFSINWVLRNFTHRMIKDLVWTKAIKDKWKDKHPDKRRLLTKYAPGEKNSIYIETDDNGGVKTAFIWNWFTGEKGENLTEILKKYHQKTYVTDNDQRSWAELLQEEEELLEDQTGSLLKHTGHQHLIKHDESDEANQEIEEKEQK